MYDSVLIMQTMLFSFHIDDLRLYEKWSESFRNKNTNLGIWYKLFKRAILLSLNKLLF